jgi:ABC-2 type transport system permease protein
MTATATPAPVREVRTGRAGTLAGTGTLIRFILRRDRIRLPLWLGAIVLFFVGGAASLPALYVEAADRQARAALVTTPGVRAFSGPGFRARRLHLRRDLRCTDGDPADRSPHPRREESGRAELVRAAVVGRHAHTAAALIVVGGASLMLGVLVALGLGSLGLDSVDWAGSWLFGAALASIGLVFAATAAVTVQASEYGRGAAGLAAAAFAVAYLVRGAGDMSQIRGGTLSWLSPIGWTQQTRVYVDNRWWPLLLSLGLSVLLVAAAVSLACRRDLAAGLVPPRRGPATADRLLSSPLGLAWRLHRTSLAWWGVGLLLFGLAYGSLAAEIDRFVAEVGALEEWMANIGGEALIDAFLAVMVLFLAVIVSIFAVLAVLRLRSEETAVRAEPILATATSQARWAASHLTVALAGSAVLLLSATAGLGLSAAVALGDAGMVPRLLGAALAHLPGTARPSSTAGTPPTRLAPRGTRDRPVRGGAPGSSLVWVVLAYGGIVGYFGDMFGFPDWTINLSPYGQAPLLPAEPFAVVPILAMLAITAGLLGHRTGRIPAA